MHVCVCVCASMSVPMCAGVCESARAGIRLYRCADSSAGVCVCKSVCAGVHVRQFIYLARPRTVPVCVRMCNSVSGSVLFSSVNSSADPREPTILFKL